LLAQILFLLRLIDLAVAEFGHESQPSWAQDSWISHFPQHSALFVFFSSSSRPETVFNSCNTYTDPGPGPDRRRPGILSYPILFQHTLEAFAWPSQSAVALGGAAFISVSLDWPLKRWRLWRRSEMRPKYAVIRKINSIAPLSRRLDRLMWAYVLCTSYSLV
jgi:hypothetical protein